MCQRLQTISVKSASKPPRPLAASRSTPRSTILDATLSARIAQEEAAVAVYNHYKRIFSQQAAR